MKQWLQYLDARFPAGFGLVAALLAVLPAPTARPQAVFPKPAPFQAARQQGLHYFLLEDLTQGRVAQRGVAGGAGFAFSRLVLPPDTRFRLWILQSSTLELGFSEFTTPPTGRSFTFPEVPIGAPVSTDDDRDGLSAEGEFVLGTDSANPDTDGDGLRDGAEVQQGLDPLNGRAARTGIIASADTLGIAQDICAVNDIAIIADGPAGISVFNIFNAMNPVIVAQVDTPGDARAVSCDGNLIAVADGSAGLAVIDISDPPAARIARQLNFGADAWSVAVAANLAFVGLANGQLIVADLLTGQVLDRISLGSGVVQDVLVQGNVVYALRVGRLHVLSFDEGVVGKVAELDSPGAIGAGQRRLRLSGGGNRLYATYVSGFNVFDLANPRSPVFLRQNSTAQFGWKQVVANGSGLALAAIGENSSDDGSHHVSLLRLDPGGTNNVFLVEFPTPGVAAAVSIYNGQGYVADSENGLQVINYLAFDNQRQAPTIRLDSNLGLTRAEEGKLMHVTATVTDDVQVRNVEFYVDGRKVATDGNFPFTATFVTPRVGAIRSFTLRARASDTGGNATWTEEYPLALVPDATPPIVTRAVPQSGALLGNLSTITVFFNEPIDLGTLTPETMKLMGPGADGAPGTPDDAPVQGGAFLYRDSLKAVTLTFATPLPAGGYRILVSSPLADLAGNPLRLPFNSGFRVFSGNDFDQDGVPDELEATLGLRTGNPDSDGNGVIDGLEDFDRDGLFNAGEIILGTDPKDPDTDGDGIRDGDEDSDADGLTDGREGVLRTNPLSRDTDQDGWTDDAEVLVGSNPVDAQSRPSLTMVATPTVSLAILSRAAEVPGLVNGPWMAAPAVSALVPRATDEAGLGAGTVLALPPLLVGLTGVSGAPGFTTGPHLAYPPVGVALTRVSGGDGFSLGTLIANPAVSLVLPRVSADPAFGSGTLLATPPVRLKIGD